MGKDFKQKTWTVRQVHHATTAEIQGTKLVNFAGDDQNPTTTTQLEELDEQSTTMAEQQQPVQEVKCRIQHNQLCNQSAGKRCYKPSSSGSSSYSVGYSGHDNSPPTKVQNFFRV